ncbi:hypothetical protein Tco_0313481 [Tanacetum coccineum]
MKTGLAHQTSMICWLVAMSTAGLDIKASSCESPPSSDSADSRASAAEELALSQKTPRTTRTRNGTQGNPRTGFGRRSDPDDHLNKSSNWRPPDETGHQPVVVPHVQFHRLAFRLNFTQRKKCAKNPVELARVKQRQGESTSVKPPLRNSRKGYSNNRSQEPLQETIQDPGVSSRTSATLRCQLSNVFPYNYLRTIAYIRKSNAWGMDLRGIIGRRAILMNDVQLCKLIDKLGQGGAD